MTRKQKIQHCKEFAPSPDEMNLLIEKTPTLQLKVTQIILFSGLRVGELAHLKSSWLHIDDKQAEHETSNYIDIPKLGKICDCSDCLLQAYFDVKQDMYPGQHSKEWFLVQQKKFYKLKKRLKRRIKRIIKEEREKNPGKHIKHSTEWYKRKQHAFFKEKGFESLNTYQWRPKTKAGVRYVWLQNDEYSKMIKEFFDTNETIGLDRRQIYSEIKKLGFKILKKKLFPHAERSSAATRLSYKHGIAEATVNNQMGWKTNLAKDYVSSDSRLALKNLKT